MKLSKNFTLHELTRSKLAEEKGIDNTPNSEQIDNLQDLVLNVVQPVRDILEQGIYVSSGFRNEELNRLLGGSKTSQHVKGQAMDLQMTKGKYNNLDLFNEIRKKGGFDQLILEVPNKFGVPRWVHVSYNFGKNREQTLVYIGGKYLFYEDFKKKSRFLLGSLVFLSLSLVLMFNV